MSKRRSLKQIKADRLMEVVYSFFLRTGWPEAVVTQAQGGWGTGYKEFRVKGISTHLEKEQGMAMEEALTLAGHEKRCLQYLMITSMYWGENCCFFYNFFKSFLHVWESGNNHRQLCWVFVSKWSRKWKKDNLQYAFICIIWSAYYGMLFKDRVTPCPCQKCSVMQHSSGMQDLLRRLCAM